MKKIKGFLGSVIAMMLVLGAVPAMPVFASGTVVVAVSASSLNIGDTVTVTATPQGAGGEQTTATLGFNYDSGKLSFVSCSESTYSGGGGGYVGVVGEKASITLKATAAGSASVSVSGSDGVIFSSNEEIGELSAGGTNISVNNASGNSSNTGAANPGGENNEADNNTNKSADNSLSALSISPGSLSPAFSYSNTSYTASVGGDVTEIAVDAKVSNAGAKVESVTGNTNLQPGSNTISIVVKAENGTTATYKIAVTKSGEAAGEKPEEEQEKPPEEKPAEGTEENKGTITLNGHEYNLAPAIADDVIPADFTKKSITCNGTEAEGLQFEKGELVLVYLTTPDTEVKNTLAVYDQQSGSFYPFMKIPLGENYIILLNPPANAGLPATYAAAMVEIGTYGAVSAFAVQPAAENNTDEGTKAGSSEFYLLYAINNQGTQGWYQYDSKEATFQRYVPNTAPEIEKEQDTVDIDIKNLQAAYDKLDKQYQEEKGFARKTIAVLIFLAAVLIVVIVNLLIRGKKASEDDWEDDFKSTPKRFQKTEEEPKKPEIKKEKKVAEKPLLKEVKETKEKPKEPEKTVLNKPLEQEEDDFEVIDLDDL